MEDHLHTDTESHTENPSYLLFNSQGAHPGSYLSLAHLAAISASVCTLDAVHVSTHLGKESYHAFTLLWHKLCLLIWIKVLFQFSIINIHGKLTKGHFNTEFKCSQKD